MATTKPQTDRLRQRLADTMIEEMIKHIPEWINTLGVSGKMSNKKVTPTVRVTAAKTGIDLVNRFIGSGTSLGGEDLLAQLAVLNTSTPEEDPENDDDGDRDEPDVIPTEGGDRPTFSHA